MLLNQLGNGQSDMGGLANVLEHIAPRIRNPFIWTAVQEDYRSWLFSIKINTLLNHYPASLLRGPEDIAIKCTDVYGKDRQKWDFVVDDEGDMHRRVRDVCAMIRSYGHWDYFVTLTCNHSKTPSVMEFIKDLASYYTKEEFGRLYSSHLPIILRLWERYVKYVLRWIHHSIERPLGPISHYCVLSFKVEQDVVTYHTSMLALSLIRRRNRIIRMSTTGELHVMNVTCFMTGRVC